MINHADNQLFLTVKDHSVSNEMFTLYRNDELDLLYTHPQPNAADLPRYYESDDYISHTDAKRSLFERIYQAVKNIALKNKIRLVNAQHFDKGILLDIGAGTGDFLVSAGQNGWQTIGIEPNEMAKKTALKKGVKFLENTDTIESHSIDVITMWHVLEHVPDVEKQIQELKRLIKPSGTILIAVPNFNSYDAKYYGIFWAAYDVPRHLWHFSKTSIRKLFEREGLQLESVLPMPFDAFYVSMLSEKYKTGTMNFVKAFFIGLLSNWKARQNREHSSHIYVIKRDRS